MSKKNARHKPSKKEICRIIYQLHDERMLQLIRGIVKIPLSRGFAVATQKMKFEGGRQQWNTEL